jgi:hypothetical protein
MPKKLHLPNQIIQDRQVQGGLSSLIKISIRSIKPLLCLFCLVISFCSKEKGEFAYKFADMDGYRRLDSEAEFSINDRIQWIYKFPKSKEDRKLGIVVQKKETVWVDVYKDKGVVFPASGIYYGEIDSLEEGRYRITVMQLDGLDYKFYDEIEIIVNDFEEEY